MKIGFIIYDDMEPLFEKIDACHSNSEKLTTKKHAVSAYSLFTHCSFDNTKNKI